MGFFNKKEDKKIELPELPGMPKLPELPPIPNLETKPISQTNISYSDFQKTPATPTNQAGLQAIKNSVIDNYEVRESNPSEKRTIELGESNYNMGQIRKVISKEPLFIKIDRFQEAVEKFEEVKRKVKDIEESLGKVKDIKDKEDQELKSWEEEIKLIKDKVANIDTTLFSKI
jgi:hypothetical protein